MRLLNELELWLETHIPEVSADLLPGATEEELRAFSDSIGIELPDQFRQLYAWHNGQGMAVNSGPWYGLNFLPLPRVQHECEMWRQVLKKSSPESLIELNNTMESTPPRFVRRQYANERWIPFAYDCGGNYLGIDLDPDDEGTFGQVINFGRDEERKIAVATSINAFIRWMLGELKAGNFNIKIESDGGKSFNTLRPEKYHFLDSLALIFPKY